MITPASMDIVKNLAKLLSDNGVKLSPAQGTPLAELVTNSYNTVCEVGCSENDNHNNSMDSFIASISKSLTNHISFTRNTVIPMLSGYETEVNKLIVSAKEDNAENSFSVVQRALE